MWLNLVEWWTIAISCGLQALVYCWLVVWENDKIWRLLVITLLLIIIHYVRR